MRIKQVLAVTILGVCLLVFTACGRLKASNKTGAQLYEALDRLVTAPASLPESDLYNKTISFSALILSDIFIVEVEEAAGATQRQFVYAMIARNDENCLLIDVQSLDNIPSSGSYVTVTGKLAGFVTFTEGDGPDIDELEVIASAIQPLPENTDIDVNTSDTVAVTSDTVNGEITFRRAHIDTFGGETFLAVYFDFVNRGEEKGYPPIAAFDLYQKENYLTLDTSMQGGEHIDQSAVGGATTHCTQPGDTTYYYKAYRSYDTRITEAPITVILYDDNFDTIYEYILPLDSIE